VETRQRISAPLRGQVEVSRVEVVRAKRLMLSALDGGPIRTTAQLVRLLPAEVAAVGEQVPDVGPLSVEFAGWETIESTLSPSHPVVRALCLDAASWEAVAELGAAGLVVPAGDAAGSGQRGVAQAAYVVRSGNTAESGGAHVDLGLPHAPGATLRLPHRLVGRQVWHLDADLFTADLAGLN
jgi:hypothetical protein